MNIVQSVTVRRSHLNSVIAIKKLVLNSETRFQSFNPKSNHVVYIENTDFRGILFIEMTDLKKRLRFTSYMREVNEIFVTENILIFIKWIPVLNEISNFFGFCDVFYITQHLRKMIWKPNFKLLEVNNMNPNLRTVILFKSSKLSPVCDFVQFVEGKTFCVFDVESFQEIEIMTFEMSFRNQFAHVHPVIGDKDCIDIKIN